MASNEVWHDLSIYLNGSVSKNALHVFVHRNRHNVKSALGFQEDQTFEFVQNTSENVNILIESFNEQGESNLIDVYLFVFYHLFRKIYYFSRF